MQRNRKYYLSSPKILLIIYVFKIFNSIEAKEVQGYYQIPKKRILLPYNNIYHNTDYSQNHYFCTV